MLLCLDSSLAGGDSSFRDLSALMPGEVWRREARERIFAVKSGMLVKYLWDVFGGGEEEIDLTEWVVL